MNGGKAEVVEQLRRVIRDDGDAAIWKPTRRSEPRPVEHDEADVESVVDALGSVA